MLQALTSPVYRSIAVGGLLLALSLAYGHSTRSHRLVLHAIDRPNCVYVSAWGRGGIRLTVEPGKLVPLRFMSRAWLSDGCEWLGRETLQPIGPRAYSYRYDEMILGCEPDAEPFLKTPRVGTVIVED